MQVVNVILVNVSMMEIHSGNLEQSALNIKIVSVEWVTVKMRHGSVT